jgi:hypothetical protein
MSGSIELLRGYDDTRRGHRESYELEQSEKSDSEQQFIFVLEPIIGNQNEPS